jgi:hypothetical protein
MEQTRNADKAIVALGWFAFRYGYRNQACGASLVKPVDSTSPFGLDRLATWNEVMCAISVAPEGVLAPDGAYNDLRESDSDFSGSARNLPEDDMWFALVRETPGSKIN